MHYSITQSVADACELIEHLGLERFHLYGQSFGGILAHEVAKHYAQRVRPQTPHPVKISSRAMSSSPWSVQLVEAAAAALSQQVMVDEVGDSNRHIDLAEDFRK